MADDMDTDDDGLERPTPGARVQSFELLCSPNGNSEPAKAQRATAEYVCKDERFTLKNRTFDNQFAQIYFVRLAQMAPRLRAYAQHAWPSVPLSSILELPEGREVALVGTLYKDMKLKPSILDEYNKDRNVEALVGRAKFAGGDDGLILEDEGARVALRGPTAQPGPLVTGVTAVVRGSAAANGEFHVVELAFAHMGPQAPLPEPRSGPDKYVALMSGLGLGEEGVDPLRVALGVDFLAGLLGSPPDQARAAQVVRCVVAGGLVRGSDAMASAPVGAQGKLRAQAAALRPVREADMVLMQLAGALPVDAMPGAGDPASFALPQQPLHACLFPGATAFPTFHRVTNPHEFEVDGITFLGTSGQNVDDVYRYSNEEDRSTILGRILEWGHLVPTAPDTLTTYPFASEDPFILADAPHVLFAGNQPAFATRLAAGADGQQTRLVCVPSFAETGTLVLVNLSTLDCHPITFDARLDG